MNSHFLKFILTICVVSYGSLHGMHTISCKNLTGKMPIYKPVAINGDIAISGSISGIVKVWNISSGECICTLVGHTPHSRIVNAVVTGNKAITGSTDHTVKVWNLENNNCLHTFEGFSGAPEAMMLYGNNIVIGCLDGSTKICDINSGECLRTLIGHADYVRVIAGSGNIIVTGSRDSTAKVWNINSGACLHTLAEHAGTITAIAISDDGKIITGSSDLTVKIWDRQNGHCLHTLRGDHATVAAGDDNYVDMIWTYGSRVITHSFNKVHVWDINTGEHLYGLSDNENHIVDAFAATVCGNKIFTGSFNNATVNVWDLESGHCLLTLAGPDQRHSLEGGCNHCQSIAASGNKIIAGYDLSAIIWEDARPTAAREAGLAIVAALHPHCGKHSPASVLPQHLVQDIVNLATPQPWDGSLIPVEIHEKQQNWSCVIS